MIDLYFTLISPDNNKLSGYELGHISFYDRANNCMLADNSEKPVIIFLTICDLLFEISDFVIKKRKYAKIVGADSSVMIILERKRYFTYLYFDNILIMKTTDDTILNLFYTKVLIFYDMYKECFDDNDPVKKDLLSAFKRVENSIRRC
ncbi:MAG: hypothetical protein IJ583_05730 [Firmicutes bacterium]|nr:hypothetical protein [Bacillota bacterium]